MERLWFCLREPAFLCPVLTPKQGWFAGMLTQPQACGTVWELCSDKEDPLTSDCITCCGRWQITQDFQSEWKFHTTIKTPKRARKELRRLPVHPSSLNKTYSRWPWWIAQRGNMAHSRESRHGLFTVGQLRVVRKNSCWAKSGSHNFAFNSVIPDLRFLKASEVSESCCLGNLWRWVIKFQKDLEIFRISERFRRQGWKSKSKQNPPFSLLPWGQCDHGGTTWLASTTLSPAYFPRAMQDTLNAPHKMCLNSFIWPSTHIWLGV